MLSEGGAVGRGRCAPERPQAGEALRIIPSSGFINKSSSSQDSRKRIRRDSVQEGAQKISKRSKKQSLRKLASSVNLDDSVADDIISNIVVDEIVVSSGEVVKDKQLAVVSNSETLPGYRKKPVRGWFLTYPQCTVPMQDAMDFFKTFDPMECIVAHELHKDGSDHLHVWFKYKEGQGITCAEVNPPRESGKVSQFDLPGWKFVLADQSVMDPKKPFHGNYQAARSWNAVKKYVTKGGTYLSFQISIDAALAKRCKNTLEMLERPINELKQENMVDPYKLVSLENARFLHINSKPLEFYHDPWYYRCMWVSGPAGIGKTYAVEKALRELYKDYTPLYNGNLVYSKIKNKFWDNYMREPIVVIDELEDSHSWIYSFLKEWCGDTPGSADAKGLRGIKLPFKILVITSNVTLGQFVERNNFYALPLERRFKQVHYDGRQKFRLPSFVKPPEHLWWYHRAKIQDDLSTSNIREWYTHYRYKYILKEHSKENYLHSCNDELLVGIRAATSRECLACARADKLNSIDTMFDIPEDSQSKDNRLTKSGTVILEDTE